jgi:hypothetical protein
VSHLRARVRRTAVAMLVAVACVLAIAGGHQPAAASVGEPTGYWMVDESGEVTAFGSAAHLGEGLTPTVAMAATVDGPGYWRTCSTSPPPAAEADPTGRAAAAARCEVGSDHACT